MIGGLMTTGEVARDTGLSPVTVRRLFREGRLTGQRIVDGHWTVIFIDPSSVEDYRRTSLGRRGGPRRKGIAA